MDRRQSLKLIATGAIAAPAVIAGCKNEDKKTTNAPKEPQLNLDRNKEELEHEKKLLDMGRFFTDHEMATITVLADIIIPKDDVSGSASDAKVPEFIDFIVRDMPDHQIPMRGGLRWLDMQCLKRYEKTFVDCSSQQQIEMVDDIAYPEIESKDEKGNKIKKGKVKSGMEPGVAFFNRMRNLTATGFYTSEIGVRDIGYIGNTPNQWNGVPDDVLKQYGVAYSEKELKECVSFDKVSG
jgi:gluconate 2-dehydrogenase gamma chain